MKYLYSIFTRTGIATMENDAKICYDRIICNLAMIISQYFGAPAAAAKMQATTLKKICFRLRTAIEDSSNLYQHSETPIYGTGQGSCAAPATWLLISSILMDCLSELGNGFTMQDVMGTEFSPESLRQWIDGFVDEMILLSSLTLLKASGIPMICRSSPNNCVTT
jgi:hypothetical protein